MFSIITLATTFTVARDLVWFIMEGVPQGIDFDAVKKEITVDGVLKIHDLHIWALTPQQWVLTAHVVISKTS